MKKFICHDERNEAYLKKKNTRTSFYTKFFVYQSLFSDSDNLVVSVDLKNSLQTTYVNMF